MNFTVHCQPFNCKDTVYLKFNKDSKSCLTFGQIFVCTKTTRPRPMFIQTVHNSLFRALGNDRNGVPVVKKRTVTAFRCVPARNEHWNLVRRNNARCCCRFVGLSVCVGTRATGNSRGIPGNPTVFKFPPEFP